MVTEITTAIVSVSISALVAYLLAERAARREFARDSHGIRTEFMAENVARELLDDPRWKKRSFTQIQKRLGGFGDDDLRKILVRAGAIRFFESNGRNPDRELWGLKERNEEDEM